MIFLKFLSRRIQIWGSSIQGVDCIKIQQRSDGQDLEVQNGGGGGGKAASRPRGLAAEWIPGGSHAEDTTEGASARDGRKDGWRWGVCRNFQTFRCTLCIWRVMWTQSVHWQLPSWRCSKAKAVGEKSTDSKPRSIFLEGVERGRTSHHLRRDCGGEGWQKNPSWSCLHNLTD